MSRRVLALTLVVTILWTTTWAAAPAMAQDTLRQDPAIEDLLPRFERTLERLDQLQKTIDRSAFDLEATLEKYDFEAQEIISFVKREVRFEPYVGLLRGARGTLMSRAGNALDQSVLLAALLKDAGYEARVARTRVSNAQAGSIVDRARTVSRPGGAKTANDLTSQVEGLLRQLSVQPRLGPEFELEEWMRLNESRGKELRQRVAHESHFLESALARLDSWKQVDSSWSESLLADATDYFWVQWRDDSGDWSSAHPVLRQDLEWMSRVEAAEIFKKEIPESLLHQFEFQVVIEQKIDDRLVQRPLLKRWRRPTARLVATPMRFANVPNTLATAGALRDFAGALSSASLFLPYFSASGDTPGEPFDDNGNAVPIEAMTSSAAGFFQKVAGSAEEAAAALGAMGNDSGELREDLLAVSAQWLEFSTISPTGERKTTRRTVLDRVSATDRAANLPKLTGGLSLKSELTAFSFMLNPGWIPPEFVLDRAIELARTRLQASLRLLRGQEASSPASVRRLVDGPDEDQILLLSTLSSFDQYSDPAQYAFRSEPSLFLVERHLTSESRLRVVTDIVWNSLTSLRSEGPLFPSRAEVLETGVAETLLEGSSIAGIGPGRGFSAFDFLEEAHARNLPFRTIDRASQELIGRLPLTPERKSDLREEVAEGFTVVVPVSDEFAKEDEVAWWRVDAESGTTLGVGPGRRGVHLTEYILGYGMVGFLVVTLMTLGCMLAVQWLLASLGVYNPPYYLGEALEDTATCGVFFVCAGVTWDVLGAIAGAAITNPLLGFAILVGVIVGSAAIGLTAVFVC